MKYKKLSTITLSTLSAGLAMLGFGSCGGGNSLQKEVRSLNNQIRQLQKSDERIGRAECVYGGPNLNDGSWVRRKSPEEIKLDSLVKRRNELQQQIDEQNKQK